MKNIYKISLILIMFICSFSSLYAFSLNIKAEYVKDSISNGCIAVFRLTQKAHQSSIDMYNNNTKYHDSDGWINKNSSTTQFFGLLGGNGNYTNHEMLIYKMDAANNPLTNFNYQARVNEYNVPVIYATSAKEMNIHRIPQISDFGYGLAYLNIHQGTSLPSNSVNVSFSEGWENRFKIVNGCIWVEDYRIPAKTIEKLKNNNIIKNEKSTARVSFATNTKNKRVIPNRNATSMYSSGADSAWKFYNTAFSYKVFGFNMGGMYNPDNVDLSKPFPEGATANVFDNVITFDPIPNQKRQVWISHNDENGNQLNGLKNDSMKIKNSNNVESIIPNIALPAEYEKYNFDSLNNAYPKSSGKTTYNGKPIIMTSYQIKIGKTYDEANPINTPKIEAGELPVLKSKNESDFVRIRVYYETAGTGAEVPVQPLEPAKLVGRLCFVNTGSFNNSTRSDLLDYIPSTETLTPYIKGAYPYIVRALNYEKITKDYVSTQSSITVSQSWHGNWSYRCGGCGAHGQTCTTDKNGKKTCRNLSGRHSGSNSGTEYYTYKYYVPYQHIYYEITNFKMFRIADVEVYDDDNNKGGILFEGTKYNLIMSNEYEKRFSGSQGIIRAKITIDEPKKSYSLNSISSSCSNCSSNNMSGTANSNIRNVGANRAISGLKSNGEDFKIKFTYFNDYVNLDETTDMIKKNENTVYYDITNENSPKQILNSANISGNSYTSELENYMKPINKLTNLEDFKQIPKNVPKDRVNGMRDLKGKITYKLVNDSKYNIGSNNFTAKNSTYTNIPRVVDDRYFDLQLAQFTVPAQYEGIQNINTDIDNNKLTVNRVNVLTPVALDAPELITDKLVNHTDIVGSSVLQKNAEFTFTPKSTTNSTAGYNIDTNKYIKGYYIKLTFDIIDCKVYSGPNGTGNLINNLGNVSAGTPVYIESNNGSIIAKTTESFNLTAAHMFTNLIEIYAEAINTYNLLHEKLVENITYGDKQFIDNISNKTFEENKSRQEGYYPRTDIISDSYHMTYRKYSTQNIGRIFDFKITDCTDLEFKNVFRNKNANNDINTPSGNVYTSGIKRWNLYDVNTNKMELIDNVGTSPKKILPLGPYKNLNTSYVNAPKLRI